MTDSLKLKVQIQGDPFTLVHQGRFFSESREIFNLISYKTN